MIRTNLEPLDYQVSNFTQLPYQLIRSNSAKTTPTTSPRTHCPQTGPSFITVARASKTSLDTCWFPGKMLPSTANVHPSWSPRGNQRWTALFHSSDVFQRWFREHDKHQLWFSLNQRCSELKKSALFQSWTALFQREIALNQRCSALIFFALNHWIFKAEQRWFSADLLWINSDIYTCRWDHQNMIT